MIRASDINETHNLRDCRAALANEVRYAISNYFADAFKLSAEESLALFHQMERARDEIAGKAGYFQGEI